MKSNTERKLTDLSGMQKAVSDILEQAWTRGRKYGMEQSKEEAKWEEWKLYSCGKILRWQANVIESKCSKCGCWSLKWAGTIPSKYCSHCGARIWKDGAE